MDSEAKLKLLKELDGQADWQALAKELQMKGATAKDRKPVKVRVAKKKPSKSERKRLQLEKQWQQVQQTLQMKNIETVVFENPDAKSRSKANKFSTPESNTASATEQKGIEIDLNKARHEIVKFGMQSLTAKALEDAETAFAISLGAKPNKRQAVNYKELQIQRKKEKQQEKEMQASMMKPKLKKSNIKSKKQASNGSIKASGNRTVSRDRDQPKGGRASGRNPKKPGRRQRNH